MKKLTITILVMFTFFSLPYVAYAATSEVTWTDHEKYRDIQPSSEGRKSFRERIFESFEKHFAKLAKNLPEGQVLKINVTDVDLAGDTHSGGINQFRIVKDIYFPRMNFSYELVNANGSIVTSDEVVIRDMSFMMGSNLKYRNESLGYEKKMLDEWFAETFKEFVVEKK
ncbi:DUF3016 domain-containing protein [Candidatus Colwellia aromaticivorans]|uniref:DUF3016 domain-containing protein n=1 Tax=Candidatus Colwellia aromaticivorans TaxID=2267621 RepID=UPI000DF4557C|nr:DUF3016 domain-containing protein [Candidatus Colwellia aromaticivorans]